MPALDERSQLTGRMAWQLYEDTSAAAMKLEPTYCSLLRLVPSRRQNRERRSQAIVEHRDRRFIRLQQSKGVVCRIDVNLSCESTQILPTIEYGKQE